MDGVHHTKLAPDQRLEQGSVPTAGRIASCFRPSSNQVAEALLLRGGEFGRATGRFAVVQTGIAVEEKVVEPGIDRGAADAEALRDGRDGELISEHEQSRDMFDLRKVAGAKGSLQVEVQGLDSLAAKGYGRSHGMPPHQRWKFVASLLRIQHPVSG